MSLGTAVSAKLCGQSRCVGHYEVMRTYSVGSLSSKFIGSVYCAYVCRDRVTLSVGMFVQVTARV